MDQDEAASITGKTDAREALAKLSAKNVRKAVITHGGEAAYVLDGTKIFKVEVPSVKIVDSTGAGDVFSAALITSYLRTREFLWSCCFGIAASSLSLNSIALAKVELPRSVDQQARKLYSLSVPMGS